MQSGQGQGFGRRAGGLAPAGYNPNVSVRQVIAAQPVGAQSAGYQNAAPSYVQAQYARQAEAFGSGRGVRAAAQPVLGLRWAAGFVDLIVICVLMVVIAVPFAMGEMAAGDIESAPTGALWLCWIIGLIGYGFVMDWLCGGTVGKLVTGTRVTDVNGDALDFGQALGRNLGKALSGCVPFYIPYLMPFWTKNRQTLHDMMAKTYVYKKSDLIEDVGGAFA